MAGEELKCANDFAAGDDLACAEIGDGAELLHEPIRRRAGLPVALHDVHVNRGVAFALRVTGPEVELVFRMVARLIKNQRLLAGGDSPSRLGDVE